MLAILNKEFKAYFKSPIGYVFMVFFLVLFGIYFSGNIVYGDPDYTNVLSNITFILVLGIPVLTMRLLSEEKRSKTDQLILTAPVKTSGYVIGKFLAAFALFILTTLITFLQPLALSTFGQLPWAKILGGYLGIILLGGTFISIGLFISALTESQVVSAIASFFVFIVVLFINFLSTIVPSDRLSSIIFLIILIAIVIAIIYNATKNMFVSGVVGVLGVVGLALVYFIKPTLLEGFIPNFLQWFSLMDRYYSGFYLGILNLSTIVYYISFMAVFLYLAIQIVEKRRWS